MTPPTMRHRTSRYRTLTRFGGLIALCALAAAGCAQSPQQPNAGETGQGQLNVEPTTTAPTTPDPPASPTPPPSPSPDPSTSPGGVTLTFIPPGLILTLMFPWPDDPDCETHNPNNLEMSVPFLPGMTYSVHEGAHVIARFKRSVDAQAALQVAQAFREHCFIARGTPYEFDYWRQPVDGASLTEAGSQCVSYLGPDLTVENLASTWRVKHGPLVIKAFQTEQHANDAVKALRHYNRSCVIGIYAGYDPTYVTWWQTTVSS